MQHDYILREEGGWSYMHALQNFVTLIAVMCTADVEESMTYKQLLCPIKSGT